ncbi:MFS transporter [Pseudomaricurvus alcaniphilus]|uniref:MFS transporter n=1 Tax=Pseudomaricurvus alcaniphilus TaxID=1166482 RepID=UPI00140E2100|nr:MFS transporter [Pseudomaricurvus alcaniphilus]NHN39894.1 MFS transporter [Pseudomaricurvus alcaniphilus]
MGEFTKGRRWLLGAFIGIGGGIVSLYFYSAGLFLGPLVDEFGWSRSQGSLSLVILTVGLVIAAPVTGQMVDRFGPVRVGVVSAIGLGLSFAMLGLFTVGLISFAVLVLVLSIVGCGSTPLSYNHVVVTHFVQHRGLALGLAMSGVGVGAVVMPPLLSAFIEQYGWRAGYLALATVTVCMALLAGLLLRSSEAQIKKMHNKSSSQLLKVLANPALYTISALIFLASIAVLGTTYHFVAMLTDRGMTLAEAGSFAGLLGVAIFGGRIITGFLLDIIDPGIVIAILLALSAFGMGVLWLGDNRLLYIGAILVGFGLGTEADLLAFLVGRRFHVSQFGTAYGVIFSIHVIGGGFGPLLGGFLFDYSGSYESWLLFACLAMVTAGVIALVTERGRPREVCAVSG